MENAKSLNMNWNPIKTIPKDCTEVIILSENGKEYTGHYACNLSGEEQPAFEGIFYKTGNYYSEVPRPISWKNKNE